MPITLPPISRRGFIKGSLAAAAGLAIGSRQLLADGGADQAEHLVLLSDIHISANRENIQHGISMWKHLGQASDEILALKEKPSTVLINGDCAFNHGLPEDYQAVIAGLRPMREAGLPIHVALGNHDSRAHLLAAMGADDDSVKALADRRVSVQPFKHADWYMLDSLNITAKTPGLLGPEQIAWLKASLEAKPDRPAIVMLHHQPQTDHREKIGGLIDTEAFLAVVQPLRQVKAVVFGHTHRWAHAKIDDLPLINLPTTAYVFQPKQPAGWVDAYLKPDGLSIQLHAITPNHPQDKEKLEFAWRT